MHEALRHYLPAVCRPSTVRARSIMVLVVLRIRDGAKILNGMLVAFLKRPHFNIDVYLEFSSGNSLPLADEYRTISVEASIGRTLWFFLMKFMMTFNDIHDKK